VFQIRAAPSRARGFRLAFVVAVVVGYAFLSLALVPTMGTSTDVLAVVPATIGGLLFGTRGGALVGFAAIPSNALLIDLAGGGNNGVIIGVSDLSGATALVIAGSLIGKLRDLSARVAVQLADRSMAHDEVRRLSWQNYLLLNAVGDGVCGLDLNGNATFVNSAAARLLGWHSDKLTGKRFSASFKTSPIDGRGDISRSAPSLVGLLPARCR
jgi:PAS domain-containing protein